MPGKAELRAEWNNAGKDVVVLHMMDRGRTRPNISPFALKFETFLKVAGIDYKVDTTQPMSSKGKTPWMTFNGTDMADSQMCIEHLCEKIEGIDTEKDLSEEQKAISRATRIMMEDHYTWCQAYLQFVLLQGKYLRPIMSPLPVPGFLQNIVFRQITKRVDAQAKAQGIGRHCKEEIEKIGLDDLRAASKILGDKPFFFGDKPTVIDCVMFGFLSWQLAGDESDDTVFKKELEKDEGEFKNLREHWGRMKEKYWGDWDEKLYKEPEKPLKKEKPKEDKKEEEEEATNGGKKEDEREEKKEHEEEKNKEDEDKKNKEGEDNKE